MFGLGTQELLIVLTLVMIIFGAGKLPQVGGALGRGIRNFKSGMNEIGIPGETDTFQGEDSKEKSLKK